MTMAVAIDTARLALEYIPRMQRQIDLATGGRRRFQIHRVSVYATIPFIDSELWRQSRAVFQCKGSFDVSLSRQGALNWQADPDNDVGGAEVLHQLHQQAATVPLLSSLNSRSDHSNDATTLVGSALSASINATTQERPLSSFHHYSIRESCVKTERAISDIGGVGRQTDCSALFPFEPVAVDYFVFGLDDFIVWAGLRDDHIVFSQLQLDVVDLFSTRTLPISRPGKRRRTAFNPFLQVSDSPVVEDRSRGNPLPRERRFNGVRYRPDRRTWVAEMKPPKYKTKQDFGNFKSEAEAARAVDAAFHHYGKPHLLNFPDTSLRFLSARPTAPPGLDKKGEVKFVRAEARSLLAAIAATSLVHSTPTNSLQIVELLESPSRPSNHLLSLSEISWPFSCSGPGEGDTADSQPHQWVDLDPTCDISTAGVQSNLETLNSVQNPEQGWDWAEDSSTLAVPPNVVNLSTYRNQSVWLDSLIRSPPAPMCSRSPSPSHFQEGIANALLEQPSTQAPKQPSKIGQHRT